MRKIFQLGGPLGVKFNKKSIDLSRFESMGLGAFLPSGELAELRTVEIVFATPDYSNPLDYGAHRASSIMLEFYDEFRVKSAYEVSGAYFWRFLEEIPPNFKSLDSDAYMNDSLKNIMELTRHIYQMCFIDNTPDELELPPKSCTLFLKENKIVVVEQKTLPSDEASLIAEIIDTKLSQLELADYVSEFVEEMLVDGYLEHGFKSEGEYVRPTFTPAKWDIDKHKTIDEYLCELSAHTTEDCPAYLRYSDYFKLRIKALVHKMFDTTFGEDSIIGFEKLPVAKEIVSGGEDLFKILGSNESVDLTFNRAKALAAQYLYTPKSTH